MSPSNAQFTFQATRPLLKTCLRVVQHYEGAVRQAGNLRYFLELVLDNWEDDAAEGVAKSITLEPDGTSLLADAIHHLIERDESFPEGDRILSPEDRKDVEMLAAALGDFNITNFRIVQNYLESAPTFDTQPTEEQVADHKWKLKRDEVFQEIVGKPHKVNIWGQIEEDSAEEDGVSEADVKALRRHAKTTNFFSKW